MAEIHKRMIRLGGKVVTFELSETDLLTYEVFCNGEFLGDIRYNIDILQYQTANSYDWVTPSIPTVGNCLQNLYGVDRVLRGNREVFDDTVVNLIETEGLIPAVKYVRKALSIGLKEAKVYVEDNFKEAVHKYRSGQSDYY